MSTVTIGRIMSSDNRTYLGSIHRRDDYRPHAHPELISSNCGSEQGRDLSNDSEESRDSYSYIDFLIMPLGIYAFTP